jgi:hypothetical protein
MEGKRRHFKGKKETGHEFNSSKSRQRPKTRDCGHRKQQNINCERLIQAAQQASSSISETTGEYEQQQNVLRLERHLLY